MTLNFELPRLINPVSPLLKNCAYMVLAEIQRPDGKVFNATSMAADYEGLFHSVYDVLFPRVEQPDEGQINTVAQIIRMLSSPESWLINNMTGDLFTAQGQISDPSGTTIGVMIIPLISGYIQNDEANISLTVPTTTEIMVNAITESSAKNGTISFIGYTSPEGFEQMARIALRTKTSITRMSPDGIGEPLTAPILPESSEEVSLQLFFGRTRDFDVGAVMVAFSQYTQAQQLSDDSAILTVKGPSNALVDLINIHIAEFNGFRSYPEE